MKKQEVIRELELRIEKMEDRLVKDKIDLERIKRSKEITFRELYNDIEDIVSVEEYYDLEERRARVSIKGNIFLNFKQREIVRAYVHCVHNVEYVDEF